MRFINSTLISFLILFAACTGSTSRMPVDADGFMGVLRTYVHADSPSFATVITAAPDLKDIRKYSYEAATGLKELETLDPSNVVFSADFKYLTLKGTPQIFQSLQVDKEQINSTVLSSLPSSLDALCITSPQNGNIGSTSYNEVQFRKSGSTVTAYAIAGASATLLGTSTTIYSSSSTFLDVSGFGTFNLDLTKPLQNDSQYFKTTVSNASWASAGNLYCHLNRSYFLEPVNGSANYTLSTIALTAVDMDAYSPWKDLTKILADDLQTAYYGPDDTSSTLQIRGYFGNPIKQIPVGATIDGIEAKCMWRSSLETRDGSIRLVKAGVAVGEDKFTLSVLPSSLTLSSAYGGPTDLWGTTWSSLDINAMGFGLQLRLDGMHAGSRGYIDYCQIKVYWH